MNIGKKRDILYISKLYLKHKKNKSKQKHSHELTNGHLRTDEKEVPKIQSQSHKIRKIHLNLE